MIRDFISSFHNLNVMEQGNDCQIYIKSGMTMLNVISVIAAGADVMEGRGVFNAESAGHGEKM